MRLPLTLTLLLSTAPFSVLAQQTPADPAPNSAEAACPGTPAAAWAGPDAAGSDASSAEAAFLNEIAIPDAGVARLAFRVTASDQPLRLEGTSSSDTALRLTTSEDEVIAENDDSPTSLDPVIETALGPGDYCLTVSTVGGGAAQARVQIGRPDFAPLVTPGAAYGQPLPDCLPGMGEAMFDTPAAVALDRDQARTTVDGAEARFLRFTLQAPESLTITAASDSVDARMALFDRSGRKVGENDDADGTDARIDLVDPLPAGDYCLSVGAVVDTAGEITVALTRLDAERLLAEAWARGEAPPPEGGPVPVEVLDLSKTRQMAVLHDGRAKWFALTMDQPSVLIVDAMGALMGVDPKLAIFGPTGTLLADNDDIGESSDARLGPILLEPGRHVISLVDVNRLDMGAGPVRSVAMIFDLFQRVP